MLLARVLGQIFVARAGRETPRGSSRVTPPAFRLPGRGVF